MTAELDLLWCEKMPGREKSIYIYIIYIYYLYHTKLRFYQYTCIIYTCIIYIYYARIAGLHCRKNTAAESWWWSMPQSYRYYKFGGIIIWSRCDRLWCPPDTRLVNTLSLRIVPWLMFACDHTVDLPLNGGCIGNETEDKISVSAPFWAWSILVGIIKAHSNLFFLQFYKNMKTIS